METAREQYHFCLIRDLVFGTDCSVLRLARIKFILIDTDVECLNRILAPSKLIDKGSSCRSVADVSLLQKIGHCHRSSCISAFSPVHLLHVDIVNHSHFRILCLEPRKQIISIIGIRHQADIDLSRLNDIGDKFRVVLHIEEFRKTVNRGGILSELLLPVIFRILSRDDRNVVLLLVEQSHKVQIELVCSSGNHPRDQEENFLFLLFCAVWLIKVRALRNEKTFSRKLTFKCLCLDTSVCGLCDLADQIVRALLHIVIRVDCTEHSGIRSAVPEFQALHMNRLLAI